MIVKVDTDGVRLQCLSTSKRFKRTRRYTDVTFLDKYIIADAVLENQLSIERVTTLVKIYVGYMVGILYVGVHKI